MFKIRKKSVFYKYLISYLLIFLVPLSIMTVMLYKNSVVNLQKEIENSNMDKLIQTSDLLDTRLNELEHIAVNISNDNDLIPYMMQNYSMKAIEGINQLVRYKSNSAFIDDLLLFFRDGNIVYSPNGQSSLDTLLQRIYHFDSNKEEQLVKDMNSIKTSTVWPIEKVNINFNEDTEVITYMIPIPQNTSTPSATVLFFIKKSNFNRMIKNTLGSFQGIVFILDKKQNTLITVNNGGFTPTEGLTDRAVKYDKSGIYRFKVDKKTYSVVNLKSENSGMTFITLMPTDQFLKKVVEMRTLIVEIVLVLVAFGIGIAFTMSINNYRPIRKLNEALKQQCLTEGKTAGRNEIDDIRSSMEYTIHENLNMAEQINSQIPLIREQVLTMLIKGNIQDKTELQKYIEFSKLSLEGPYYSVMVITLRGKTEDRALLKKRDEFLKDLYQQLEKSTHGYVLELIQENIVAFILNLTDESTAGETQSIFARKLQDSFIEYFGSEAAIGVGSVYNNSICINRSFVEALAAIEHKLVKGSRNILFFNEVVQSEKQVYWYPIEEQLRFTQSVKQGDAIVALENLHFMMEIIAKKGTSFLMLRFICFDIINMVVKTLYEMNMNEFLEDIEDLMEFESLDKLEGNLENLIVKICNSIENSRKSKNEELRKNILQYIDEHYIENQISLELLSEKFGFSIYYLSRFFREQTGDNFIDYLTELRMNNAKNLLTNTNIPIKNIVTEIGYVDVPNFVRKFKIIEGITPGKYRKLHARK